VALPAGAYVRLRVTDTGCGMDQPTVERAFEPFFSTKEPGRGTGLGLSTVDGIVRQSGGVVLIDSALGRGTTFTILLPRTTQAARITGETEAQGVPALRPPESSTEALRPRTILVVEDDPGVRKLATLILNGQGYRVLAAGSGSEALLVSDGHKGKIDLLITDLVLPGMSGPEIARTLRAQLAPLPVLFMSGYADEVVAHEGMNPDDGAFLAKPFTPASLVASVRAAIG
jgi:CheY-like chemotaxis protein